MSINQDAIFVILAVARVLAIFTGRAAKPFALRPLSHMQWLITFVLVFLCPQLVMAQFGSPEPNRVLETAPQPVLEAPSVFVRGFPAILKIKCIGPQRIPETTLFTSRQQISVNFESKEDGKVYSIQSSVATVTVQGPLGSTFEKSFAPITRLAKGEQHTMLLDLYSLRESNEGLRLIDVPNGKYTLQLVFPNSRQKTLPCEIDIVAPSSKQKEFLLKVRERQLAASYPEYEKSIPDGISNWAVFLEWSVPITDLVSKLDREEREIMGLHLLLSELMLYPEPLPKLGNELLQRVSKVEVPLYLETDKECFLLELAIIKEESPNVKERVDALLHKDAGLAWRIEQARAKQSEFLFRQYNLLALFRR